MASWPLGSPAFRPLGRRDRQVLFADRRRRAVRGAAGRRRRDAAEARRRGPRRRRQYASPTPSARWCLWSAQPGLVDEGRRAGVVEDHATRDREPEDRALRRGGDAGAEGARAGAAAGAAACRRREHRAGLPVRQPPATPRWASSRCRRSPCQAGPPPVRMWRVPSGLYDAIRQDAVLLKAGEKNPAAGAARLLEDAGRGP
jgi:hypothetical protein